MEQDFDIAIKHMSRAATLAMRARAPRLLEAACMAIYNFGRIYDNVVKPPLKCDVQPFWLTCDCYLDALEGGWWRGEIDEKQGEGEKEKEGEGEKETDTTKVVEEWLRDFVCFTLEGLAGEHEFANLVELGERFNRLTNSIYAGICNQSLFINGQIDSFR